MDVYLIDSINVSKPGVQRAYACVYIVSYLSQTLLLFLSRPSRFINAIIN